MSVPSNATRNVAGAIVGGDGATTYAGGTSGVTGVAKVQFLAPQEFTEEAWFKTTSTQGGKIIGFGTSTTADSATADRHLYLSNNGLLNFGVLSGGTARTVTTTAAYNNGQWHHVVATLGGSGMRLYVDGSLVGEQAGTTFGRTTTGTGGWPVTRSARCGRTARPAPGWPDRSTRSRSTRPCSPPSR